MAVCEWLHMLERDICCNSIFKFVPKWTTGWLCLGIMFKSSDLHGHKWDTFNVVVTCHSIFMTLATLLNECLLCIESRLWELAVVKTWFSVCVCVHECVWGVGGRELVTEVLAILCSKLKVTISEFNSFKGLHSLRMLEDF